MFQRIKNIVDVFRQPLQSAAIIFLFLLAFIMFLWIVMTIVRILMG